MDARAFGLFVVVGGEKAHRRALARFHEGCLDVVVGSQHGLDGGFQRRGHAAPVANIRREEAERLAIRAHDFLFRAGDPDGGDSDADQGGGDEHPGQRDREDARQFRADAVKVDIEGIGQGLGVALKALHDDGQQKEDADAGAEDHPAFEVVEEPFGVFDAVEVDEDADHTDAKGIHEDGLWARRRAG